MATTMFSLATLVLVAVVVQAQVDQTRVPGGKGVAIVEAVVHALSTSCIFPNDHRFLRRLAKVASNDGMDPNTYAFGNEGGIWQVNEAEFLATQSSALVAPYYAGILSEFGIDWPRVQWSDLRKPFYSGVAAMLSLVRAGLQSGTITAQGTDFPRTMELQATFYQQFIKLNDNSAAYNFLQIAKNLSVVCGSDRLDVAFLIDSSSSLAPDDFTRSKAFATDFVKESGASVNANGVKVAFVTFSTSARAQFTFNSYNNANDVINAIDSTQQQIGSTDTSGALAYSADTLFTTAMGSRFDAAKIAIVLTDGQSDDPLSASNNAQRLRDLGVTVFVIGVGIDVDVNELNTYASKPQCTHVQKLDKYGELATLQAELRQVFCTASVPLGPALPNNPIHVTNQCGKVNSFTILTTVETTIRISPKSGFVEVFGSYTSSRPSAAFNDFASVASSTRPAQIYIQSTTKPLYLTIQSDALQSGQCGSDYDLDIVFGDTLVPISEKVCVTNALVRQCTPLDLLRAMYQVTQLNPINLGFVNPCPVNAAGHGYHPHPMSLYQFIYCEPNGNIWRVQCNSNQYYSDIARGCINGVPPVVVVTTPRPTPRPTTRPTPQSTQPWTPRPTQPWTPAPTSSLVTIATGGMCAQCTTANWNNGIRFFAYPGNETLYIMCTEYVGVCRIKQCAEYHKWNPTDNACVYQDIVINWTSNIYQTSPHPSDYLCPPGLDQNDIFFHPHPDDITKFVHCDEFGDAFVQQCKNQTIWNQQLMTCIPGMPLVG